jgi:hypothetical protein
LATVDEESAATAHLAGLLRVEIECAGSGDGGIVHGVLAVAELILGSGERANVAHALLVGIHVANTLARVAVGVDVPLASSTDEVASLLVVCVVLGGAALQGLAACGKATLRCVVLGVLLKEGSIMVVRVVMAVIIFAVGLV